MLAVTPIGRPSIGITCSRSARQQVGCDLARGGLVGAGEEDGELVAAEPGEHVGLAHAHPQQRGDAAKQVVAGAVAERVVDVLEVVEVEHQHGAAAAVAPHLGDPLVELVLEPAAVERPVSGS